MIFNNQQKTAIQLGIDAITQRKLLTRIGGYAGTGKTTILREIYEQCFGGAIVAFAGKACDVLRRKGLPGQTIHSLIYKWNEAERRFYLVDNLEGISWIGVDEGSMVGSSLWGDLTYFGKPMLVIGDPGQLEPVNDDDPHLMKNPDLVLDEIHRQALNSPIIKLSMQIRENDDVNWKPFKRDRRAIESKEDLLWPDMVICGFNKTRLSLNTLSRKYRGFDAHLLNETERIICKQNDRELGVFNGQMFTVTRVHADSYTLLTDDGKVYEHAKIADVGFNSYSRPAWSKTKHHVGRRIIADYGNVITCHGAQGSEYDKVAYIDEQCDKWCPIRHRYTGVTRAANELGCYMSAI